MKLKDIKISKQLQIGLGIILGMVILLGIIAWSQANSMWQETKGLYDHPLTVRRAIEDLQVDVLSMHEWMTEFVLTENEQDWETYQQAINMLETDAKQQFTILYDRYLGPVSDVDNAHQAFVEWKAIRAETIRLVQEGNHEEALKRVRENGPGNKSTDKIMENIEVISDYAINRGDQFYQDAQSQRKNLVVQLWTLIGIILALTIGIRYLMIKGISAPLEELTGVTEQFQQGKLDARSQYTSANEFGILTAAFNNMADTIQAEFKINEGVAHITGILLKEDDLRLFSQKLLETLLENTQSQIGAIYLLNEQVTAYTLFESVGLKSNINKSFPAKERSGEFGMALATKKIQHISEIQSNTNFTFSAVIGDILPRAIITIPILVGEDVVALISLASIHEYTAPVLRLVEEIWSMLTARINGVLDFHKTQIFSTKLEEQNRELSEQARELSRQASVLNEQNAELEMQKKQLDEANRLKSVFLSNMSHELRTPLNSVIALSGVLNRRLSGIIPEEEYSYLEVIERNGKHLLSLINDILDLSRIEAGREEITLSQFSAFELVGEVTSLVESQALEKGISLLNLVGRDLPLITSDYVKCRQILKNIVDNAIKFTELGKVEISAVAVDGRLSISISDTGIGINTDQIPFIFDEFRQADGSTSRKYGGSGLGLSIAKKYAMLLHGEIIVESMSGEGSIFTLRLPLEATLYDVVIQRNSYSNQDEFQASTAVEPGQKCILVVEDTEAITIQLTDILSEQGYKVQTARNGREALEYMHKKVPDAVILDLMMPEVDGFQVLRMLRAEEKTVNVPVLILTAKHVTREELAFLKGNHIHQLILKGNINKKDLLAAINRMVTPREVIPASYNEKPVQPPVIKKPVILVIEDNPDNRETFKAMLQDSFTIHTAEDGLSGITCAKTCLPDLILMDISMPGMDGFKTLEKLRGEETISAIPVLAVTARAMKGDKDTILEYGFDGYISKPVDTEHLEKAIYELLNRDRKSETN